MKIKVKEVDTIDQEMDGESVQKDEQKIEYVPIKDITVDILIKEKIRVPKSQSLRCIDTFNEWYDYWTKRN